MAPYGPIFWENEATPMGHQPHPRSTGPDPTLAGSTGHQTLPRSTSSESALAGCTGHQPHPRSTSPESALAGPTVHQPRPLSTGHAETRTEVGDARHRSDRDRGGGRGRGGGLGPGRAGCLGRDMAWWGEGGLWRVLATALGEGLPGRTWKLPGCSCVWSVASKKITTKKAATFVPGENISQINFSETYFCINSS